MRRLFFRTTRNTIYSSAFPFYVDEGTCSSSRSQYHKHSWESDGLLVANGLGKVQVGSRVGKTTHNLQWWDTDPETEQRLRLDASYRRKASRAEAAHAAA